MNVELDRIRRLWRLNLRDEGLKQTHKIGLHASRLRAVAVAIGKGAFHAAFEQSRPFEPS